jgi:hypothetical protein
MQKSKTVILEDLLAAGKPVYVKNATKNPAGIIHLSITDPNSGKSYPLNIPKTWIPFCLNDRLSRSMIEGSFDLRQCIANGALKLMDPEEAMALLEDPDAKMEMERINKSIHVDKQLASRSKELTQTSDTASTGPKEEYTANPEDLVNQKVVDTVLGIENNTTTVRDAVSIIRTIEDNLSENDFSYIVSRVEESQFKKYAQKKLSELRGE